MEDNLRDQPTEAIYIDKDQADCLLIILSEWAANMEAAIPKLNMGAMQKWFQDTQSMDIPQSVKAVEEYMALNRSLLETVPSILEEIREIYPVLQESTHPKLGIIKPVWMNK